MYKCVNCKRIVTRLEERVRCPYCGTRVFVKLRPEVIKRVQAR